MQNLLSENQNIDNFAEMVMAFIPTSLPIFTINGNPPTVSGTREVLKQGALCIKKSPHTAFKSSSVTVLDLKVHAPRYSIDLLATIQNFMKNSHEFDPTFLTLSSKDFYRNIIGLGPNIKEQPDTGRSHRRTSRVSNDLMLNAADLQYQHILLAQAKKNKKYANKQARKRKQSTDSSPLKPTEDEDGIDDDENENEIDMHIANDMPMSASSGKSSAENTPDIKREKLIIRHSDRTKRDK